MPIIVPAVIRMESDNIDEEEDYIVLHRVLSSLQHFLSQFGFVPSRVAPFMATDSSGTPVLSDQTMVRVIKHERADAMKEAVLSFVQDLLCDEAPPRTLYRFKQALIQANNDVLKANEGAWRVHDILTLACAYWPLQEALVTFLAQGQDQQVNLQDVVAHMNNRRLLKPEYTPQVLETLSLDGVQTAAVHMLASVYATRVCMLRDEVNENSDDEMGGRIAREPPGGDSQVWLLTLMQGIEAHGGQGFSRIVPESVLTADTWATVYDAESEAGESIASDHTLLFEEEETDQNSVALDDFTSRPLDPRDQLLAINLDSDSRKRRTMEYVYGANKTQEISHTISIFRHEFQLRGTDTRDGDENCSVVTSSSSSTSVESNSQVRGVSCLTTVSGLQTQNGEIALRAYQEELLVSTREGKNVTIVLPTGTGKTFIVLKYVQEHLNRPGLNRIVFLAPKVKLAEQQYQRFLSFFPMATYFRCGRSRSSAAPFSELLDTYQVFVMTPQCLVEAVQMKEVKITDFSVLVLDECHHVGQGRHAYSVLMELYRDAKCAEDAKLSALPQIIGLTASPGIGSAGMLKNAISYIRELCFKMDVERICTVRVHKQQLKKFVNEPQHEIHMCLGRKHDRFRKIMELLMNNLENEMTESFCAEDDWTKADKERLQSILIAPKLHRGRPNYNQWVFNLDNRLTEFADYKDTYKRLFCMVELLAMYHRCLILNEDCHSQYALNYLKEKTKLLEDQVPYGEHGSMEKQVLEQLYARIPELQAACDDVEDYNPKLVMLEETLLAVMEKNEGNLASMIFVRSIELTRAIQCWIAEHGHLACLNPGRMTGRGKTVTEGGMTSFELSEVVQKFNSGEHKVVVCTSCAEEGLDFQACNVVVRYDYVTSMISMIQTRGRARHMDSQYCVLGDITRGNINKEKANLAAERLMDQAVAEVQKSMEANSNSYLSDMSQWQRDDCLSRKHRETSVRGTLITKMASNDVYQLLCRKCQCYACKSSDIRLLEQSSRAVVEPSFKGRWKSVKRGELYQFKHTLDKVAKIHCKQCSYDWGSLVRYRPTSRELPVIRLESFFLVKVSTGDKIKAKLKWAAAPFHVEGIRDEELM